MTGSIWPDWGASINDASASDWITVAAYIVAAGCTYLAAASTRGKGRDRTFWLLTTAALVFLGFNELFDLQMVLTRWGRARALEEGWFDDRRLYQFEFTLALAALGVVGGLAAVRLMRRAHRAVRAAMLGLLFLGIFVLLRAASFHHVDEWLGMGPHAFNAGSVQEMLGIVIIAVSALWYRGRGGGRRRARRRR